jgi:ABC-type transporter MlaC component
MKALALIFSFVFSLSAFANPTEAVSTTVGQLLTVLQNKSAPARVRGLCRIVNARVDIPTIGTDLLGPHFSRLTQDVEGIRNFRAILPSVIVTEFADQLSDEGTSFKVVSALIPKGSGRVGVRVNIGTSSFVVTVNKANEKVLDVEWRGISLVKTKRQKFQYQMQAAWERDPAHSKPISQLVNSLINSGDLIRCN